MSETIISGAFVERSRDGFRKIIDQDPVGAHYSVWHLDVGATGKVDPEAGMRSLRSMFPDGEATDLNFVLFSTSGVHGSYTTIEDIEEGLRLYGDDFEDPDEMAEGWHGNALTVLIVQPRIVCLRCGNVRVRLADVPFLKKLRASSLAAVATIGLSGE